MEQLRPLWTAATAKRVSPHSDILTRLPRPMPPSRFPSGVPAWTQPYSGGTVEAFHLTSLLWTHDSIPFPKLYHIRKMPSTFFRKFMDHASEVLIRILSKLNEMQTGASFHEDRSGLFVFSLSPFPTLSDHFHGFSFCLCKQY